VRILDEIPPESFAGMTADEIANRVRGLMATVLGDDGDAAAES
jgi:hypothetical protein